MTTEEDPKPLAGRILRPLYSIFQSDDLRNERVMNIEFIPDFQIDDDTSKAIVNLLGLCFPDHLEDYGGRDYFKQLPHHRLLAYESQRLVGHVSIDYRVMNLNCHAVKVFGVIDLCVVPDRRGAGIGSALLRRFEEVARSSNRIDCLFLAADDPKFYERLGYTTTSLQTTWLKIHDHENYGLATERITDAYFLYKTISDIEWKDGDLDLLGYMY